MQEVDLNFTRNQSIGKMDRNASFVDGHSRIGSVTILPTTYSKAEEQGVCKWLLQFVSWILAGQN